MKASLKPRYLKFLFLILIAMGLSPLTSKAQSNTDVSPVIDHVAISARDLKKSTEFYANVMHLQKVANPFADTVHQWFSLGNNVKLHVIKGDHPDNNVKAVHLCFIVASVKDFGKTLDKLNIPYGNWNADSKEPTLRQDGIWQLYFQDPDGYWIEIDSPAKK